MTQPTQESPNSAQLSSTRILDYQHPNVQSFISELGTSQQSKRDFVLAAHTRIVERMKAVYSIDEDRPVSETLRLNEGSCGQRMAAVEALARAGGVPTRVRALWLDRRFWFSRLPLLRFTLPPRTLMPWPQFYLDDKWVDFDELYGSCHELAVKSPVRHAFSNAGESLFDAIRHAPVDFLGKLKGTEDASFDISHIVVEDGGFFDTRDELMLKLDKPTGWLGRLIFNTLYGGRPVRRIQE
jgi:hypothetical protein